MRPTLASPVLETYPSHQCNDFPQLSKANIKDRHHYAVGASKPCCPPPPPPLPLVPSDTMVARNLASFASHAVRDVPFVSHQKGRIEISNMFPVATISGAGIATNQHTVRYPSVKAEEFCFLTSCLQQPKMCVGCFVLLRPGHFGLSQAQKS